MPRYVELEPPKKRIAANGYRLPDPIREGEVLTDLRKCQWRLGRSIGVGGFGEIYLASDDITKPVSSDARYVIKVEPHSNGPLFVEMNFYFRVAKMEMIDLWVARNELKALGMPYFVGTGSHIYKGERYRFLVIPRFGEDLEKLLILHNRIFHIKTVLTLASYIVDTLEYIHGCGYIHGDIKPGNLLLGQSAQAPVYLVDFGLACRYKNKNGEHKEYCIDERKAHYGTIEYTSRDAHIGALSRRGDLEILGYNLVHWLTGHLPWEDDIADPEIVAEKKRYSMANVHQFLVSCFAPAEPPDALEKYLLYVGRLDFDSQPNYKYCKKLFRMGIRQAGYVDDNSLTFNSHPRLNKPKKRKINLEPENRRPNKAAKLLQLAMRQQQQCNRKPCATQNSNRMTRNAMSASPNENSLQDFNWAMVLAGDPEQKFRKEKEKPTRNHINSFKTDYDTTPRVMKESFNVPSEESLDNPTPVMLQVLARMKERTKESTVTTTATNKRSRNESSRCSSPTEFNNSTSLTPAMEEVIRRRLSNATRTTRSSSRRSSSSSSRRCSKVKLNLYLTTTVMFSPVNLKQTSPAPALHIKRSTRLSSLKG